MLQALHAKEFLQMRTHREIEAHTRRQRLLKPSLVDRDNLAAPGKFVERALYHLREFRIGFAEHQRVIGVRKEVADDTKIRRRFGLRQHSIELNVVVRVRVGLA